MTQIREYYRLAKPGIVYGNLIPAVAGFLLASKGHVHWLTFIETLVGIALVIGAACAYNNYLDRGIDRLMTRTKQRATATGRISIKAVIIYATILGILGFLVLVLFTNLLTVITGIIGIVGYVAVYGFAKRHSVHGTLVGSISGAMPPVAGYTAVTDHVTLTCLCLFFMLVCWQMPHFYAIAIYREKDYRAARLPVLPIIRGYRVTKQQMLVYICGFGVFAFLIAITAKLNVVYAVVIVLLTLYWLQTGLRPPRPSYSFWARRMFGLSLLMLLLVSLAICVSSFVFMSRLSV
jgi:protoheme IX farnesyltransferase